jgi:diphosphate--fructose-6-phosphate 1-phosphotransferase
MYTTSILVCKVRWKQNGSNSPCPCLVRLRGGFRFLQYCSPDASSHSVSLMTHTACLSGRCVIEDGDNTTAAGDEDKVRALFPHSYGQKTVTVRPGPPGSSAASVSVLRIGIVLSGGPAPGGHNVICGLFDYLHTLNPKNQLFGFIDGPDGILKSKFITITKDVCAAFVNQGGFHMIGSGRGKIESEKQKKTALAVCNALRLNGLVVVGGDDSNTNAAILAEYFLANKSDIKVCGVPKTIDGDLRNEFVEVSFGFDTATKVYSECVAALCADAASAKKGATFIIYLLFFIVCFLLLLLLLLLLLVRVYEPLLLEFECAWALSQCTIFAV